MQTTRSEVQELLLGLGVEKLCYYKCPGNAGDALIHSGTVHALERMKARWERVEPGDDVTDRTLLVGGGGNLTPLYDHVDRAIGSFLESDPRRIVVLPHGIRGRDEILARLRRQDIVVCRDQPGFDHVRRSACSGAVVLAHDMAFHLDAERFLSDQRLTRAAEELLRTRLPQHGWTLADIEERSVMRFVRIDAERGPVSPETDLDISYHLMVGETDAEAALAARCLLECVRRSRRIVTDRLHVAVAAALLGIPCQLLPNSYDKNLAVFRQSLAMFPNVRFTDTTEREN